MLRKNSLILYRQGNIYLLIIFFWSFLNFDPPVIGPKIVLGGKKINSKQFQRGIKFTNAIFFFFKKKYQQNPMPIIGEMYL
jgi:hypothetical protein